MCVCALRQTFAPCLQDVFAKEPKNLENPESVGVLLCGQKDMCQAVTDMLKERGVQQIMLNFWSSHLLQRVTGTLNFGISGPQA